MITNLLTYVFSCLMKLEKLLCLKNLGNKSLQNSGGFQTIKLLLLGLQPTIESVEGSSTISYAFTRKGGSELELPWASSIPILIPQHSDHQKPKTQKPSITKKSSESELNTNKRVNLPVLNSFVSDQDKIAKPCIIPKKPNSQIFTRGFDSFETQVRGKKSSIFWNGHTRSDSEARYQI